MADRYFVESDDVDTMVFDWGAVKWLTAPAVNGAERFSAGVVQFDPGKGHDVHTHPDSDEILFVISGEGEQTVADETRDVAAGEMVFVPAGIEHGTRNTGWETLKMLVVYAPPGPEAAVSDLPECTVVPAGELPTGEG